MIIDNRARRDCEFSMEERKYLDQPDKRIQALSANASHFPKTSIPAFPLAIQRNLAISVILNSRQPENDPGLCWAATVQLARENGNPRSMFGV